MSRRKTTVIEFAFKWLTIMAIAFSSLAILSVGINIVFPGRIPTELVTTLAGLAGGLFGSVTTIIIKYGSALNKSKNGGKDK